jgi:hypothetical protein
MRDGKGKKSSAQKLTESVDALFADVFSFSDGLLRC